VAPHRISEQTTGICGSTNGCVAVYVHRIDDDDEGDQDRGHNHDK
jgi:hypothetical protein